jgi:hypothetical protein
MRQMTISLQLMDSNLKPVHACTYTVTRSVEQQLHKGSVRLVDIGVLEEDYSSQWASPSFAILKKNGTMRFVTDFRNQLSDERYNVNHFQLQRLKT